MRAWSKRWNEASWPKQLSEASLRKHLSEASWPKQLNEDSIRDLVSLPRRSRSSWPLVGMFAIGVVAGAVACYAVAQRSEIKRLFEMGYEPDGFAAIEEQRTSPSYPSANHRRKATSEVKQ